MGQKITFKDNGAKSMRVLEALTPLTGIVAPAAHAAFIGQLYVDTVATKAYISVAIDSELAADDWKEITLVAGA